MSNVNQRRDFLAVGIVVAGMLAWELARAFLGDIGGAASASMFARSLTRAALLLLPAGVAARELFQQRLVTAFWLGPPEPAGVRRAVLLGGAFLGSIVLLSLLLDGGPLVPSRSAGALALLVFDAAVEEALFRGFLLSELSRCRSPLSAKLVTALLFVAAHTRMFIGLWNAGAGFDLIPMLLILTLMALTLGGAAYATRSIWISVAIHSLNNLLSA